MASFNGLGMHLGNLPILSKAESRSISPENPTGEKGKGAMAMPDPVKSPARKLGRGWKVSPYIVIEPGEVKMLEEFGKRWGFDVQVVPPMVADGVVVSSSAVREALREGRVEEAVRQLGRPFGLGGRIRRGTGQGRKLIVPTLNLATKQECLPKNGVYATQTVVQGKTYESATNIGTRPTFNGTRLAIESHLFDFSESLTSGRMEVRFHVRLRDEQKFTSPEALKAQVLEDIERAKDYFRMSGTTGDGR